MRNYPQDFLGSIKDVNVKEIIAKESLEYQPSKSGSESMAAQRAAVGQLVELGHSVFHKFGRLQVVRPPHCNRVTKHEEYFCFCVE